MKASCSSIWGLLLAALLAAVPLRAVTAAETPASVEALIDRGRYAQADQALQELESGGAAAVEGGAGGGGEPRWATSCGQRLRLL